MQATTIQAALRNPDTRGQVLELVQRANAIWRDIDGSLRMEIEQTLSLAGVERRGSSWAYKINGRTHLIS